MGLHFHGASSLEGEVELVGAIQCDVSRATEEPVDSGVRMWALFLPGFVCWNGACGGKVVVIELASCVFGVKSIGTLFSDGWIVLSVGLASNAYRQEIENSIGGEAFGCVGIGGVVRALVVNVSGRSPCGVQ